MSWQNPNSAFNPNANTYNPGAAAYNPNANTYNPGATAYNPNATGFPGGPAGGFYPPPPQGYGGGFNAGGYYPSAGAYGGYGNNAYNAAPYQRGGMTPQPARGGGYYPTQQRNFNNSNTASSAPPVQQAPAPAASANTAKAAAADAAKLSLGGAESKPAQAPAKKKAGTLSLGKKKQEVAAATTNEGAKGAEAKAEQPAKPQEARGAGNTPNTSAPMSPTSPAGSVEDAKQQAKMSAEEMRAAVREAIAKQRAREGKQFKRDPRPHFNVVFCGHVDAGKSTISGHLLMEKGMVDQREMDKLRREAEVNHREGWEYAYVMDVSEEERSKGITRETGAAYFETDKRRITVLDAPGHKAFVPSMIGGATQADVCVLVISSRTGEFETGFEKGGQTREHAMLVRTCGVKQMICVINKMDEMDWSQERYDEIVGKLKPFLRSNGYDEKLNNLVFIPVAGLTGENLLTHTTPEKCAWYKGQTVMEVVDNLTLPETKDETDVLCIPVVGGYKDDGKNFIYGKVESGSIAVGEKLQLLPGNLEGLVEGIFIEDTEFEKCYPGDNVHLRVRGIDENDVHAGYVATSIPTSMRVVEFFQARVVVLEVKNIICEGSRFMLHIHAAQEEASFHKLLAKVDKKTGEVVTKNPACAKAGDVIIARIELNRPLVVEPHKDFDKMGRFMLRDEGKTIAIGLVTKLYESTHASLKNEGK